jgi:hypothetical protein
VLGVVAETVRHRAAGPIVPLLPVATSMATSKLNRTVVLCLIVPAHRPVAVIETE